MLCPLCRLGGRRDEEAKGQGLGADFWDGWLWGLRPLPTADFCPDHFFLWQHDIYPPPLGSFQQHPNFHSSNLTCDSCCKNARIPREINCLVSHCCLKPETAQGPRVQKQHKALSLHPWAGLGLPLRDSTERSSLWETPHQESLECHSALSTSLGMV